MPKLFRKFLGLLLLLTTVGLATCQSMGKAMLNEQLPGVIVNNTPAFPNR